MVSRRRDFLKKTGLLGAWLTSTLFSGREVFAEPVVRPLVKKAGEDPGGSRSQLFNMCGYRAPRLENVRIGFVGLGNRGSAAVPRVNYISGVSIKGLCDIRPERIKLVQQRIKGSTHKPVLYSDSDESWKEMCERDDIDVIYIATPWNIHIPIAIYAMEHGKHVALEVGPGESLDECWALVNASEQNKRHCIFLENCCYDFFELLTLNMAQQGYFGEIVHCEGAYIHNNVVSLFDKKARYNLWRLRENVGRNGNLYPTHGLGPIAKIMNINRGEKLDYMVSMSSADYTMKELQKESYQKDPETFKTFDGAGFRGNMNTSVIKTNSGKTIMLQHDVSSPRVYSRIYLISGTKGSALKYPMPDKIAVGHEKWLSDEEIKKVEEVYTLPIVKKLGEMAKEVGGHGGMDFLMDWRWIDCLHNGLPMDHDVYDAALWMSIAPLSEWSVAHSSAPVEIPDFTRGSWKKNKPVDMSIDHPNLTPVKKI